jgi:hypothetical protein
MLSRYSHLSIVSWQVTLSREHYQKGKANTVDLLIKVACLVKKKINSAISKEADLK